jgi:hypothetical protein
MRPGVTNSKQIPQDVPKDLLDEKRSQLALTARRATEEKDTNTWNQDFGKPDFGYRYIVKLMVCCEPQNNLSIRP